mgnify:CR=1 FL=1
MLLELLQALKTAFETLLDATISQWLEIIRNVISDIVPSMPTINGFSDFMTACLYTFIPYRAVFVALSILAPIYLYNLVINIIFFAKSFTPLGGD